MSVRDSSGSGVADPFAPTRLGPIELRNHIIKAATFEGMSPDNVVTDELVEFHKRLAGGGVAMTTLAYVAVSRDGMGAPAEIYIHDAAAEGLAGLADAVHREGARLAAQLGHAGAVGELPGKRVVGPSRMITLMGTRVAALSAEGIDDVVEQFAAGARLLAEAGVDSIELHFGHHYLVSEFMSPKWNRRTDEYGGSVENRARLPRRILRAVRDAIGPDVGLTAKMNMVDAVRGGLGIDEGLMFASLFEHEGVLDAMELSAGGSLANQMFMFRGDAPRRELASVLGPLQRAGFRLAGRAVLREYPFEEAYLLPMARRFRERLALPLILLGGVNRVETIAQAMAEGFEFVAMGRALLREPDLVARMEGGHSAAATCIHCNKCMVSVFSGTRCVIDHPQPRVSA